MTNTLRSLYICYFPLTEPLVQTQVVAYLRGLATHGHTIHLLTFETSLLSAVQKRQWRRQLRAEGIIWHCLRYHKRPSLPATVYDMLCGVLTGLRIIRRYHLNTVHARSHVPATMGFMLKKLTGCRFIFDIRGLLAEEYVDVGNWQPNSLSFLLTKALERHCIKNADGIVVLTNRVRHLLLGKKSRKIVRVIPCCADLTHIEERISQRDVMRVSLCLENKVVMIYTGKLGGWYMHKEMVEFFQAARKVIDNLYFIVLTQSDPLLIHEEFTRHNISHKDYMINRVDPKEVSSYLAASDFGIAFYKQCLSIVACSPTKAGEYLAAGLPVLISAGVGDMDTMLTEDQVGVIVNDFTDKSYHAAVTCILNFVDNAESRRRCQQAAHNCISLQDVGVPCYHSLYTEIAQTNCKE